MRAIGTYVVYASKNPVTEKLVFPEDGSSTYTAFAKTYDFLLMMLSTWEMDHNTFQNRGIRRNPLSIIEGSHKGISMLIHGFSAAVWNKYFQKQHLYVKAMPSMSAVLQRELDFSEYLLDGRKPSKETILTGDYEQPHLISVSGLIKRYEDSTQEKES